MIKKYGFVIALALAVIGLAGGFAIARQAKQTEVLSLHSETLESPELVPAELENTADGYKLSYPNGWRPRYYGSELHLSPPAARGELIIKVNAEGVEIQKDTENTTEHEQEELDKAETMVSSSFERIESKDYENDKAIINERFSDL